MATRDRSEETDHFFFGLKMLLKCVCFHKAMREISDLWSADSRSVKEGLRHHKCFCSVLLPQGQPRRSSKSSEEDSHKREFTKINHPVSSAASRKWIIRICVGYLSGEKWEKRTEAQVEIMAEAPMGTRFRNNEQQSTKFYIVIVLYVLKGQAQQEEAGGRVEVKRERKTED